MDDNPTVGHCYAYPQANNGAFGSVPPDWDRTDEPCKLFSWGIGLQHGMLSDNVVIVTGGGNGLGEAAALDMAAEGATVVVNDLGTSKAGEGESSEAAESTVEEIEENGGTGMAHFGDVADVDYTGELVQDTYDAFGRIDGVINFAGIMRPRVPIYEMSEEVWDRMTRVHLKGHYSILHQVSKHWVDVAGEDGFDSQRSFVGITSISIQGASQFSHYAAAKSGVQGLVRTAAMELDEYNIRVNALSPSASTPREEDGPSFDLFTHQSPHKVSPMVAFMMSDHFEDVTGCTMRAAGGLVGMISEPDFTKRGFREDGWTTEMLEEHFFDHVLAGEELTKLSMNYGPGAYRDD